MQNPSPGRSAISICGQVGSDTGPGKPVSLTLDGEKTISTGTNGSYRFDAVSPAVPPGLPPGNHVLVASGEGLRTKIVRFSDAWLARQGERDCQAFQIDLSPTTSARDNRLIDTLESHGVAATDEDGDGVDDAIEDWLAERFAPIVYHEERETNFPVNVDFWLANTRLSAVDGRAGAPRVYRFADAPLSQPQLLHRTLSAGGAAQPVASDGSRSRGKVVSFVLEDVGEEVRVGESEKPADWITYVHSYANQRGGITIQYWRAYSWNDARFLFVNLSHGGDWEGIAVHLDSSLHPEKVAFLEHAAIVYATADVQWEGSHPLVWSETGGHSSYPNSRGLRSSRWFRQETWTGGAVTRWTGELQGRSGGLRNLGEKSRPRNGQVFVQYSGLWGSRKTWFLTSGYWGPAFNETGALCSDGSQAYRPALSHKAENAARCGRVFLTAWCDGMAIAPLDLSKECYAATDTP